MLVIGLPAGIIALLAAIAMRYPAVHGVVFDRPEVAVPLMMDAVAAKDTSTALGLIPIILQPETEPVLLRSFRLAVRSTLEARRRGAEELYLSVFTENHRAKAFYRRYGFAYVGPYKFMVGEQADEDEIWKLDL